MRVERFYHSAPSAAENSSEFARAQSSHANALALFERAFPQALEASAYALRKRLVCPRWWLTGVMAQWASKDTELLSGLLALNEGNFILSSSSLTPKTFPLVVSFWTEVFFQLSNPQRTESCSVEFESARVVRGTSQEVAEQREFLTSYLSSALRIQRVKCTLPRTAGRRSKSALPASASLSLESIGLVQIIENVVLQEGGSGRFVVTFTRDPKRLFSLTTDDLIPPTVSERGQKKKESLAVEAALVTLQPDILQAMSRSQSPKKLLPYLSLELLKTENEASSSSAVRDDTSHVWRGRCLGAKELSNAHKEQISLARAFYDHGLLSWENEAPRLRVRELAAKSSGTQAESGIVHCWRLSQHAVDAVQFEHALTSYLNNDQVLTQVGLEASPVVQIPPAEPFVATPRVPVIEAPKTESAQATQPISVQSRPVVHPSSSHRVSVPAADVVPKSGPHRPMELKLQSRMTAQRPVHTHSRAESLPKMNSERSSSSSVSAREQNSIGFSGVWSDDEYLMSVAEFYESLTPLQQQAFERERRRMSPEQFRQYVTPALKRHRVKNA